VQELETVHLVPLKIMNAIRAALEPADDDRALWQVAVIPTAYVFINERGQPFGRMGIGRRRLQHFLGHASITNTVRYTAMSPEPFKDIWR
jgi:hypothetical protein